MTTPQAPNPADFDNTEHFRPPVAERMIGGRTQPAEIHVTTRFLYSDAPYAAPASGKPRHAFSRGGNVTASDFPTDYDHQKSASDHLHRAIASFGDDKNLIVTVALATEPTVGSDA
jgi:hypothetical protein